MHYPSKKFSKSNSPNDFQPKKSNFKKKINNECIIGKFIKQVKANGDRVALHYEDTCLNYKELNMLVNRMANHLETEYKIKRQEIVGVLLGKSPLAIICMLALFKLRAVYLPLNINYPANKILDIYKMSKMTLLLSESIFKEKIHESLSRIIFLDEDKNKISNSSSQRTEINSSILDIIYIIFSSGTTGEPKGVCIQQKALLNYINWKINCYKLNCSTITLQISPLSFDGSLSDIFSSILVGGSLILFSDKEEYSLVEMVKLIKRYKVNHMAVVPSLYNHMLNYLNKNDHSCIQIVTIPGEKFTRNLINRHFDILPNSRLITEYGATEACIASTFKEFYKGADDVTNVGKPIFNTQVYVLDNELSFVEQGELGEIYIGGDGVCLGYLNSPQLNSEKYIKNPFVDNDLLYKTGDIGRWKPNDDLEFVGREDNQIKLRGNRIELGEIERVLQRHSSIRQSLVMSLKEDGSAEDELVAYIESDETIDRKQLDEYLNSYLPKYMLPQKYIILNQFPVTDNGKIHRKKLIDYMDAKVIQADRVVASTFSEMKFLKVLRNTFIHKPAIKLNDNFFSLGGHSLLAIEFAGQIQKEFCVPLSVKEIFSNPDFKILLAIIESKKTQYKPRIFVSKRQEKYELSHAQKAIWFASSLDHMQNLYYTTNYFFIKKFLNVAVVRQSMLSLVSRHEALRTTFEQIGTRCFQKVHPTIDIKFDYIDATTHLNFKKFFQDLVLKLNHESANLNTGPIFHPLLIKIKESKYILIIKIHHIICDAWSLKILARDFWHFYNVALCETYVKNTLPDVSMQFKDYVTWHNQYLISKDARCHQKYWNGLISHKKNLNYFRYESEKYLLTDYTAGIQKANINKKIKMILDDLCQVYSVSPFIVILAALSVSYYRLSGYKKFIFGFPIAARINPEINNTVGYFATPMPVEIVINETDNFACLIVVIKEICLNIYDHQIYSPFNNDLEINIIKHGLTWHSKPDGSMGLHSFGKAIYYPNTTVKHDIWLHAVEFEKSIQLIIEYRKKLFKQITIKNILKTLLRTIEYGKTTISVKDIDISDLLQDFTNRDLTTTYQL